MPLQKRTHPGADHSITIERNAKQVVVTLGGRIVADTTDALILREAKYSPVQYIPRKDVDLSVLTRSETTSHCPYKGDASYFSIIAGTSRSVDAIWSYEAPFAAVSEIEGYLAFYPDRADLTEERG